MRKAERIARLGTETAFAVGAEAAARAAKGFKVYPFHLGDINLPTPENIRKAALRAMDEGRTGYCPNAGIMPLRELIARDVGMRRDVVYTADNVAVQPGGKPVIGKFLQIAMNPGDEALYPNPGYPIYESMIGYLGGVAKPYLYREGDDGFFLDMDRLESQISDKTTVLIYNNYQNPTGAESSEAEMARLAELAVKHDLWVLSDEAYFENRYSGESRSIVSYPGMKERTIILYTFGKKFAMTGWRLGAGIGPAEFVADMVKINTNDESCTNHFVQYAGVEALTGDQSGARRILDALRSRRDVTHEYLSAVPGIRCHKPEATFYLYPEVSGAMERLGLSDVESFRRAALEKTGVSFCTRYHFGNALPGETGNYLRFAYSGIGEDDIREGLTRFREWIEKR